MYAQYTRSLRATTPACRQRNRCFSSSASCLTDRNRAIVYTSNGPPAEVLRVLSFPVPRSPKPKTLNIRFRLSPFNPSDINVIEGVYPSKPAPRADLAEKGCGSKEQPCFVAGNEGLAEVRDVGDGVENLKMGDWVVMVKPQAGTWSAETNVQEEDVIKIPEVGGARVSEVQGATMTVNPSTAFNMLKDFVCLNPGDWVIQNGANSAVGQAVIQLAHHRGLKTINFVRDRPDIDELSHQLKSLGADHVLTLESLSEKSTRSQVKELTNGSNIRLALNCVSGPSTTPMVSLLGQDSHLVSYGAMSKQPLTLPTPAFLFKNLKCHGFWQSRWYKENGREKREALMRDLVELMTAGKLKEPTHTILDISSSLSDEEATHKVREAISGNAKLRGKILVTFVE